jgi:WhiB family redox-sensing transcriptional regulator
MRQCRNHAIEFEEKHGIWGGMTVDEITAATGTARTA